MTVARSAADVLAEHVQFELDCIDRLYLNLYVPILQQEAGVAWFWRHHRGAKFPSSALMAPMSNEFISSIERFAREEGVPLIRFQKGERKEDVAREHLARNPIEEGVLFIGKAQEKTKVIRTIRKRNPETGQTYPWLQASTAMVNHYYFYCVDPDFGLFFVKFGSYFPYNGKLCLNGHEYLKCQLRHRGVAFEPLENGLYSCEAPQRAQRLADGLSDKKVDALARKWFARLPHPFPASDRRAGFRYQVSILQAEFATTQVFDRPLTGRVFFEQMIRDHLDLGRPDQVQLIFDRRVTRRTPGRFRTRVITDGVIPSLHIDYKSSRIKQYHKEGRALRTETVVNNTYDFAIGRLLKNLVALRQAGFSANQRLLDVQTIQHDSTIGEEAFDTIQQPQRVEGQHAPALRFGDRRVLALLAALLLFRLLPRGFSNRDLREHVAPLLSMPLEQFTQGRMTYDLRRMRLHGLIERIPKTHRYQVTHFGFRTALFYSRAYTRLLRPGLSLIHEPHPPAPRPLQLAFDRVDAEIQRTWADLRRAA